MNKEYKLPEMMRKLLKEKKISGNKLAYKMDVSQKSVYEWMNGITIPSLFSLMALAKEFDVGLDYLVYGKE